MQPSSKILSEFSVSSPILVEETAIATIWKVRFEGDFAALKIYKNRHMGNERAGFSFLADLDGLGAAKVMHYTSNAALVEWLDGPSLGDLTRNGHDDFASTELVAVANLIHSKTYSTSNNPPRLEDLFKALFELGFTNNLPDNARQNLNFCKDLAQRLLASQHDIRVLHGDLHHDNIRLGARGYCAFDAKGVLGERCYELANAFRNPKGADQVVRNPDRVKYLATLWSDSFNVERARLLEWAAVKCALSIAWRCKAELEDDREFDLLSVFVRELA